MRRDAAARETALKIGEALVMVQRILVKNAVRGALRLLASLLTLWPRAG
jgi:hypothetical protein